MISRFYLEDKILAPFLYQRNTNLHALVPRRFCPICQDRICVVRGHSVFGLSIVRNFAAIFIRRILWQWLMAPIKLFKSWNYRIPSQCLLVIGSFYVVWSTWKELFSHGGGVAKPQIMPRKTGKKFENFQLPSMKTLKISHSEWRKNVKIFVTCYLIFWKYPTEIWNLLNLCNYSRTGLIRLTLVGV